VILILRLIFEVLKAATNGTTALH